MHRDLPDTDIAYISIKPSPSRISLLQQIRETNALIRDYADAEGKVDFIDVYTPMLDASGKPRPELFRRGCAASERRRLRAVEARHRAARALTLSASLSRPRRCRAPFDGHGWPFRRQRRSRDRVERHQRSGQSAASIRPHAADRITDRGEHARHSSRCALNTSNDARPSVAIDECSHQPRTSAARGSRSNRQHREIQQSQRPEVPFVEQAFNAGSPRTESDRRCGASRRMRGQRGCGPD